MTTSYTEGSLEGQVTSLSTKINALTKHLSEHKNDLHSHRGLLKLVGQRRRLLVYLRKQSPERYDVLIAMLGLRTKQR